MKVIALLLGAVVIQVAGNLCLSVAMKDWASVWREGGWPGAAMMIASAGNPWFWSGVVCLIGFTVLFMIALSWTDLSLALPVVAVEVIVNVAGANWILGERVTRLHWLGTGLIAAGLILVAASARAPRTETGVRL